MIETTPDLSRFNWTVPSYAALAVIAVCLAMVLWSLDAEVFLLFLVVPVLILVTIALIIYAIICKVRRTRVTTLSTMAVFWLASAAMFLLIAKHGLDIRTTSRWLIWSRDYKAEVLAQPTPANGDFKHIEWDGWGFVPAETTVYLVFDPSDSLSRAARSRRSGKFVGIPCTVPEVKRLEKHWYTVLFYTDEDWSYCGDQNQH